MSPNYVKGLLTRFSSSSRQIWERQFGSTDPDIETLCKHLLTLRGETSAILVADAIIERLSLNTDEENLAFYEFLLAEMQPNPTALEHAAKEYLSSATPQTISNLAKASDARFMSLFRMISTSPRGPHALVKLRQSLRRVLRDNPHLQPVDQGLVHLFRSWFNRGFLKLEKIDWTTPAHILEKLIAYEAVHEINGWSDLRRRLGDDRRCYAFFHPALKDEPLIFVQVALTNEIADNIQELLTQDPTIVPIQPKAAIFYSISNCQPGLTGISFGNYLIKQVVKELSAELPDLKHYATLSPVPGFRKWLEAQPSSPTDEEVVDTNFLMQHCAQYLIHEKRREFPLDPVARFHLGNGACLNNINWGADSSERGQKQSFGIMVNYVYDMAKVEKNHEAYVNDGVVATNSVIQKLAGKK